MAILVVLTAVAPLLADLGPVRRFLARQVAASLGYDVEVGEVDAGWGSGVALKDIVVTNPASEFSGAALLEVKQIHLDQPLHEILLGTGDGSRVLIDGAVLRIDELGGGRTSLDEFVRRLTAERKEVVPPPAPKPLEIRLRDCTIEVRHMAPPPPAPPVDPFRHDPRILPATAHVTRLALESFDFGVATGPGEASLDLSGGIVVDGPPARIEGHLRWKRGRVEATFAAERFDLSFLAGLLHREFGCTVDVNVEYGPGQATVDLKLHDLVVDEPGFDEKLLHLGATLHPGEALAIDGLFLRNADQSVRLTGQASFGADSTFDLAGHAPLAFILRALRKEPAKGTVHLDRLRGSIADGILQLKGATRLTGARPDTVSSSAEVRVDMANREIAFQSLRAESPTSELFLKGRLSWNDPLVCDLSGDVNVDLAELHAIAAPYLELDRDLDLDIRGRASVPEGAFRIDEDGDGRLYVRGGRVTGFALGGLFPGTIRRDEARIEIEASLKAHGNELVVEKALVAEASVTGNLVGLREKRLRSGHVAGSSRLVAEDLRALGLDVEVRAGLGFDAHARTDETGLVVTGTITASDVAVNDIERKTAELTASATYDGERWRGNGKLTVDALKAKLRLMEFEKSGETLRASIEPERMAVAELVREWPDLALPDGLDLGGEIEPTILVTRQDHTWTAVIDVPESRLTARIDGRGLRKERVSFVGRIVHDDEGTRLGDATLMIGDLKLLPTATLSPDGGITAELSATGMVRRLADYLPELKALEGTGWMDVHAKYATGEPIEVHGSVRRNAGFTLHGRRVEPDRIEFKATGNANGRIDHFRLTLDDATVEGRGRVRDGIRIDLTASGKVRTLAAFFEGCSGNGDFRLKNGSVRLPPPGEDGPFQLRGEFEAEEFEGFGFALSGFTTDKPFHVSGDWRGGAPVIESLVTDIVAKARAARVGKARIAGLRITQSGNPKLGQGRRGFRFFGEMGARSIELGKDFRIENARLVLEQGRLDDFRSKDSIGLLGKLMIATVRTPDFAVTSGWSTFHWWKQKLTVSEFAAQLKGGTVKSIQPAVVDFGPQRPKWNFGVEVDGVDLDEDLGRALTFTIPILRLSPDVGTRKLSGKLHINTSWVGSGFDVEGIEAGRTTIELTNVRLTGSTVLSLLKLRPQGALKGAEYHFARIRIQPKYGAGRLRLDLTEILDSPLIQMKGDASIGTRKLDYRVYAGLLRLAVQVRGPWDDPSMSLLRGILPSKSDP